MLNLRTIRAYITSTNICRHRESYNIGEGQKKELFNIARGLAERREVQFDYIIKERNL